MTLELQRKRNWDDISFEIFYRFSISTIVWIIIAGILFVTGGTFAFTIDNDFILTLTTDLAISVGLTCFGISMIGLIAPLMYTYFWEYLPEKRKESKYV